jgi:hypothetical protein
VPQRALVGAGLALRGRQHVRLAREPGGREERAVRGLRRVREGAMEAVYDDRRPAVYDRERVPPEPQRVAEGEVGGEQWVRPLPRKVRRCSGHRDDDRLDGLVECGRAALDRAKQRFDVGHRGRPRVRGRHGQVDA